MQTMKCQSSPFVTDHICKAKKLIGDCDHRHCVLHSQIKNKCLYWTARKWFSDNIHVFHINLIMSLILASLAHPVPHF